MAANRTALFGEIRQAPEELADATARKQGVEVLAEQAFVQVLRLERRRTERSGNPFILVLLNGWASKHQDSSVRVQSICEAIASTIRETDVLGWYAQDEVLAVLLTEVGRADEQVADYIAEKISDALRTAIGADGCADLDLLIRIYPQPAGTENEEGLIYRDLSAPDPGQRRDRFLKRAVDIVGSSAVLILFLPVFLTIGLLVKLTSKGPVLYCQKRVGKYGRLFDFYKFRSMYCDNDPTIHQEYVAKLIAGADGLKQKNGTYKLADDPRVTSLGKLLRRTSLDEIPQFMNVLLGDMSLVGPRPPIPYEFNCYRLWHKRRVMEIKPGLTGLWQVKGRSRTTFDEMVRMDIRYATSRSLIQDIKIILETPGAMFTGSGAS
jgi:lipopolysaccharide/colanic/teichoic acid biosynthesis glycosyltransferase